jgi:lysozyme
MTDIALVIAANLIRGFEGCVLHPYQDVAGVWTIGIGSVRLPDGSHVTASTPPITRAQAEAMMQAELAPTAARVDALVPAGATEQQRAACYSFAYNLGVGAFAGSTLLRLWRAGDTGGAAAEFPRWVYAAGKVSRGLQNRRAAERDCFEGGPAGLPNG